MQDQTTTEIEHSWMTRNIKSVKLCTKSWQIVSNQNAP